MGEDGTGRDRCNRGDAKRLSLCFLILVEGRQIKTICIKFSYDIWLGGAEWHPLFFRMRVTFVSKILDYNDYKSGI